METVRSTHHHPPQAFHQVGLTFFVSLPGKLDSLSVNLRLDRADFKWSRSIDVILRHVTWVVFYWDQPFLVNGAVGFFVFYWEKKTFFGWFG